MIYTEDMVERCVRFLWDPTVRVKLTDTSIDAGMPRGQGDPRRAQDHVLPMIDVARAWDQAGLSIIQKRIVFLRVLEWSWERIALEPSIPHSHPKCAKEYRVAMDKMVTFLNTTKREREEMGHEPKKRSVRPSKQP